MVAGCTAVAWRDGPCQLLALSSAAVGEEQWETAAGSRVWRCRHGAEPGPAGAVRWKRGWLVSPSLERLFIKINNGMLVWERALNQLFLRSYRCLFFKAMYSAKHTASVAEIATEQPSQLITGLPNKESFVSGVWGGYSVKTWWQYIKNCSLSFKPAQGCTTLAPHAICKRRTVAILSCPSFSGGW